MQRNSVPPPSPGVKSKCHENLSEQVMELATWVPVTVVALVLFHLLLLNYLNKRRSGDTATAWSDGSADGDRAAAPDESSLHDVRQDRDVVQCRECGAANECEYRYCRYCGSELPGRTLVREGGTGPIGGLG